MPAINVARTDTFEQQRIKINEISEQIFAIGAGGTDLATGNLKLGDGDIGNPSLTFTNDTTLGIFRPANGVVQWAYNSKKLLDIKPAGITSFRNLYVEQSAINPSGIAIINAGSNYDAGIYSGIALNGGSGSNAFADIVVTAFSGTILEDGENYVAGTYNSIPLVGGAGNGTIVSFTIPGIEGDITNAGSAYPPGSYSGVGLTTLTGSGSNAIADVEITGSTTYTGTISNAGSGYSENTYSAVTLYNIPTLTYTVIAVANPGTPPPDNVYQVNGATQPTLNLTRGNTYRFDVSDVSMATHPLSFTATNGDPLSLDDYVIQTSGIQGEAGSFVDLIIKPTATAGSITYICTSHEGMGANATVGGVGSGNYGSGATANITVDASGVVTSVLFAEAGSGYKANDVVFAPVQFLGGSGSGFQYTIQAVVYTGVVTSVVVTTNGSNYETGDTLSFNNSSVGGFGSGFIYTITSNPGSVTDLVFDEKGTGYSLNDVLSLPPAITGLSVNLPGQVTGVATTLSTATATITVASTANIIPGMGVETGADDTGELSPGTTVSSIVNGTTLILSAAPVSSGAATLSFSSDSLTTVSVPSAAGISLGSSVTATGNGSLDPLTIVSNVDTVNNVIELNQPAATSGSATLTITPPFGDPATDFQFRIDTLGTIESISASSPGTGYVGGDSLTINDVDLSQPITKLVTNLSLLKVTFASTVTSTAFQVGDLVVETNAPDTTGTVEFVKLNGGNIEYLLITPITLEGAQTINIQGSGTTYTVDQVSNTFRFYIDGILAPSLTLYVGDTYRFDYSDNSNSGHIFAFSEYRDGNHPPSFISNVACVLVGASATQTVASTAGIQVGMLVSIDSGLGTLQQDTRVAEVVDATTVIFDKAVLQGGNSTLSFSGVEYTEGVDRAEGYVDIKVTDQTPSPLYYYCATEGDDHQDESGADTEEATITIDPVNNRVFGSGALFAVAIVDTQNVFSVDVEGGELVSVTSVTTPLVSSQSIENSGAIDTASLTASTSVTTPELSSTASLKIAATTTTFESNVRVGTALQIDQQSGDFVTQGELKTNNSVNVNDLLFITDNNISTPASTDILLTPPTGRIAKVSSTSALTIPSGTTAERPAVGVVSNGSIRFNTETAQYEGYSESTTTWSSLGGVRDLDGNTYIKAEESVGSNDNTLWFINDDDLTVKFGPSKLEFVNNKTISSLNPSAPAYTNWNANTPVVLGQYLKYKQYLYEVTGAGTTAGSSSPPTHTSGAVLNGGATLTFWGLAAAALSFSDITEVRIGPTDTTALVVNGDIRLSGSTISTDVSDLSISPNSGKKVIIDANTSLVLPTGLTTDRGVPLQGSVRFNTQDNIFEGYDGTNWGSLGGVKDVDQDTYIKPELSAGTDEDTLYFFNANNNTLRLSLSGLDFYAIDTVRSMTTDEFEITASILTIDSAAVTLDNTRADTTRLHSSKQFFEIGMSYGLGVDHIFKLDNQGDVYFNTGFSSGSTNEIRLLDKDLKEFELTNYRVFTEEINLVKGTIDAGVAIVYDSAVHEGAKVVVVAHNTNTGNKEFVEFGVVDNGTDVFYTEYGNITTGENLVDLVFDFTANSEARLNIDLNSAVGNTHSVNVTVTSYITKK